MPATSKMVAKETHINRKGSNMGSQMDQEGAKIDIKWALRTFTDPTWYFNLFHLILLPLSPVSFYVRFSLVLVET